MLLIKALKFLSLLLVSNSVFALSISTYNIRNFDSNSPFSTDVDNLVEIIKNLDSEIMVFQEIVDTLGFKNLITQNTKFQKVIFSSCGGFGKQKLALTYDTRKFKFLKLLEDTGFSKTISCDKGVRPLLKVKLRSIEDNVDFWVLIAHFKAGASNRDIIFRKKQFSLLSETISKLENFVILGDLNTTKINSSVGDYYFKFVEENSLLTSANSIQCTSFWSGGISDGLFYPSKLDHILVSPKLRTLYRDHIFTTHSHCNRVKCSVSNARELGNSFENVSDHCPIKLVLTKGF